MLELMSRVAAETVGFLDEAEVDEPEKFATGFVSSCADSMVFLNTC